MRVGKGLIGLLPASLVLAVPPLLWAGNFVVGRAVRDDVPPLTLAFLRHLVAFVCLLPIAWPIVRKDASRYWQHRWTVTATGISGLAAFSLLVYVGLHHTSASNAQLMNSTIPVLIILFGAVLFGHRLVISQVIGLLVSCVGVLIIMLHGDIRSLRTLEFSGGDLLVLAAMASFALFSLWLKLLPADMDRLGLLAVQLFVAAVVLLPFSVWELLNGAPVSWGYPALGAILYVGIVASVLANLLYMMGVARVGAAKAGLFIHLLPVYGAFMSVVFLGEQLHGYHAAGLAAIIAGLAISRFGEAKRVSNSATSSDSKGRFSLGRTTID